MFTNIANNWSIRRYTFIVTGMTFLVLGLMLCEIARQVSTRNYHQQFEQYAETLTSTVATATYYDIRSGNKISLMNTVSRLITEIPNVNAIDIYGSNNTLLASLSRGHPNQKNNAQLTSFHKHIIEEYGVDIGRIEFVLNISHHKSILQKRALTIYFLGIVTFVLCALLTWLMLNHILVSPVRRIHEHLQSLQKNEVPKAFKLSATKELFHLGNTVNELGNVLELKKQEERELEAASKSKSDFLANMSHELRTPINGVLGMLTLLRETPLDPQQTEQIRIATSSSKSLLTLINDILDYSKLEAGKFNYEHIEFSLEEVIEECAEAMSESAFGKNLNLLCQIDPDVPAYALGDPTRLRQVMTNLVGNAIKFTENGLVKIHVQRVVGTDDTIKFSVIDTGIGMSESGLKYIFKSFAQADSSTTRKFGGTGLGLTISRRIVEGMHGQIGVNSIENEGSTFWFTVELASANRLSVLDANQLVLERNIKVLLIENNKASKECLSRLLKEQNFKIVHAKNGHQAFLDIKQANRDNEPYDVVLFTTQLKDMSAALFVKQIDNLENLQDLKLIAINTISQPESNLYTHNSNRISGHISKPVRRNELVSILSEAVEPISRSSTKDDLLAHSAERNNTKIIVNPRQNITDFLQKKATNDSFEHSEFTILIADDNLINQQVAQGMLEQLGFQTILANDGSCALDVINQQPVDLVLMDCQMPILDGFETTQKIRDAEFDTRLPIIALTANVSQSDADKCYAAGMDHFLTKPIDINILEKTLIETLRHRFGNDVDQGSVKKAA